MYNTELDLYCVFAFLHLPNLKQNYYKNTVCICWYLKIIKQKTTLTGYNTQIGYNYPNRMIIYRIIKNLNGKPWRIHWITWITHTYNIKHVLYSILWIESFGGSSFIWNNQLIHKQQWSGFDLWNSWENSEWKEINNRKMVKRSEKIKKTLKNIISKGYDIGMVNA